MDLWWSIWTLLNTHGDCTPKIPVY